MIIPDVNLLLYAHNRAVRQHAAAHAWWTDLMTREQPIGLPWAVSFGFVRLITHPTVLVQPLPPEVALSCVRSWLEREHVRVVDPGPRHLDIVAQLFAAAGVAGRLTTDVHLAALAIEHQATVHTTDTDFSRFPGLRHTNPLG